MMGHYSHQDYLGKTHSPEALREQARACFHGSEESDAWAKGKMYLLIAARMGDRGASWLLALYYREGRYGFEQDRGKSEYWRKRTDQRLKNDAALVYDDATLQKQALHRYQVWQDYWRSNRELFT
jgi:hypothetical protein